MLPGVRRFVMRLLLAALGLAAGIVAAKEAPRAMQQVAHSGDVTAGGREDHDGVLWFATGTGPVRFDGVRTSRLNPPPGIFLSRVGAITVARDGRIWFGRNTGGVVVYNKRDGSMRAYQSDPADPYSLSSDTMHWAPQLIAESASGEFWIGTHNGLNRLDPRSGRVRRYFHDPARPNSLVGNNIWCVIVDRQDRVWVGTTQGLSRLDPGSDNFVNYRFDARDPTGLADATVLAVAQASDGGIWVGTQRGGLSMLDPASGRFTHFRHDPADPATIASDEVFSILPTRDGQLVLGRSVAVARGVEMFDLATRRFTRYARDASAAQPGPGDTILSAFEGADGSVWLPFNHGTVYRLSDLPALRPLRPAVPWGPEPGRLPVLVFTEDAGGASWMGGVAGLSRIDVNTGRHVPFGPLVDRTEGALLRGKRVFDEINSIVPAGSDQMWIGEVDCDFLLVNTRTAEVLRYLQNPGGAALGAWNTVRDPTDPQVLWFSSQTSGLGRVDTRSGRYSFFNRSENPEAGITTSFIASITPTGDGQLWLAARGQGLLRFDGRRVTRTYAHRSGDPHAIASSQVNRIVPRALGQWWVATVEGGLNLFDEASGRFTRLGEAAGIPDRTIYGVESPGDGSLWIGTADRLYQLDAQNGRVRQTFDLSGVLGGGMLSWPSGLHAQRDGVVFVGSLAGAALLDLPGLARVPVHTPRVLITRLSQNDRPLPIASTPELARAITLRWPMDSFEAELSLLSNARGLQPRLRYRLHGHDEHWVPARPGATLRYTDLPGGAFELQVEAAVGDQPWQPVRQLTVQVVEPFWRTPWFRLGVALFLLALLALGARYRHRRALAQMARLEDTVALRTGELQRAKERAERAEDELTVQAHVLRETNEHLEARVDQRTEALNRANERLRYENEHDVLTGLLNRRAFHERLEDLWRGVREDAGKSFALLIVDMDNFKVYNTTFGHAHGDAVLCVMARRISECVPADALLCRFGGDQFLVALRAVDTQGEALDQARRLLWILNQPVELSGQGHSISCSIGVACSDQTNISCAGDVLYEADAALARVKRKGGGDVGAIDVGDVSALMRRHGVEIALSGMLRQATPDNHIVPYYHAIVDNDARVVGFEALARWWCDGRFMEPAKFLDAAILSSNICLIDLEMMRAVARDLDEHYARGNLPSLRHVNLNVFGTGLHRGDFVPRLRHFAREVSRHGLRLNVELTEQAPAPDLVFAAQELQPLREELRICLDDFGTGNASLAHLLTIRPDVLKIDASFVRGIGHNADHERIVRSTIALAKSLRITLIAEGVETEFQSSYLQALGCDYLQGWLFDKPLPAKEFFRSRVVEEA